MRVEELTSRGVQSCSPTSTLAEAAQIMWSVDCGCVPAVDANRTVCGIITDRDVCNATLVDPRALARV